MRTEKSPDTVIYLRERIPYKISPDPRFEKPVILGKGISQITTGSYIFEFVWPGHRGCTLPIWAKAHIQLIATNISIAYA